jgi:hypothetical protein
MLKSIRCREHGGIFRVPPRRGRPPVRCTEDNPCAVEQASPEQVTKAAERAATAPRKVSRPEQVASEIKNRRIAEFVAAERAATAPRKVSRPEQVASEIKNRRIAEFVAAERAATAPRKVSRPEQVASEIKNRRIAEFVPAEQKPALERAREKVARQAESFSKPRSQPNPSLALAQEAKRRLEALGWTVKGRAWVEDLMEDPNPAALAQVTAVRGDETISLTWQDGTLVDQNYSLWSETPSDNGMPAKKLSFNPAEMTDGELVRAVSGMKVTWWNALARSNETAVVGKKLTIEHIYDTIENGGTDAVKRLIKFVDLNGSGFRAFHVDALLKVG